MFRCLNDQFAYCKGTPKEGDKPVESGMGLGNGCTKDPVKCGHYLKESEQNIQPLKPNKQREQAVK